MSYIVDATKNSPKVSFDTNSLEFEISGRSMPENTRKFYDPIVGWIKTFNPENGSKITLKLDLNYLNTSSTIALLEMLKEMAKFTKNGCFVIVFVTFLLTPIIYALDSCNLLAKCVPISPLIPKII